MQGISGYLGAAYQYPDAATHRRRAQQETDLSGARELRITLAEVKECES